jgi:hypothetical protein
MSAGTPGFGVRMFAEGAMTVATAAPAALCERAVTVAVIAVASAGGAGAMLIPFEAGSLLLHAARRTAVRTARIGRRLGKMGPGRALPC